MQRRSELAKKQNSERGSALIVALVFMLILSALAASVVFITQIEVSSATLYRQTMQARYVAESGAQTAEDWLSSWAGSNPNSLPIPNIATQFDTTQYPVALKNKVCSSTDASGCVYLSTVSTLCSATNYTPPCTSYPDPTVAANFSTYFNSGSNGNAITGVPNASYTLTAQLMAIRVMNKLGGGSVIVQSWKITSQGNVKSIRNAQAQVKMVVESFPSPIFSYGAFGTASVCPTSSFAAISLNGLASTDSYDSSLGVWSSGSNSSLTQGNVGSNATTSSVGNATINGTDAWNPSSGCPAPNGSGNAGNVKQITPLTLPTPTWNPPSQTATTFTGTALPGVHYGNVSMNNQTLTLTAGTYYFDSLSIGGTSGSIVVSSGPVIININPSSAGPSIGGNGIINNGTNGSAVVPPSQLQILYAGNGTSSISGNGNVQAVLYAPNSAVTLNGGGNGGGFMGAIYGNTVNFHGGPTLHYDRQLANSLNLPGPFTMTAFSWDKY